MSWSAQADRRFEWSRGAFDLLARAVAGAVLLYAGIAKTLDPGAVLLALHAYRLVPAFLERPVAMGLPWLEITLGALLTAGLLTRVAGLAAAVLSLAFIVAMAQAKARGLEIGCGCFGQGGAGTALTWFDLLRDPPLLAAGVYLSRRPRGPLRLDRLFARSRRGAARRTLASHRDGPTDAPSLRPHTPGITLGVAVAFSVVVAGAAANVFLSIPKGPVLVSAAVPSAQVSVAGPARTALIPAGSKLPEFSAPALGGGMISGASYHGAPTVLVVWAPWCADCEVELPILNRVAKAFPVVRLTSIVTGVGQQLGPTPAQVMRSHHFTFPVALDTNDQHLADAFGVAAYPTVYYVRADGTVARATAGAAPPSVVRSLMGTIAK